MFMQMANNKDILAQKPQLARGKIDKIVNTYISGLDKMKKTIRGKDPQLRKFKKHVVPHGQGSHLNPENDSDVSDAESITASSVDL